MCSIAIYGGAYDPIHLGHLWIAAAARQFVDQVWLMPCYTHMFNKNMTRDEHRINMCNLSINEVLGPCSDVKVSLFEIENQISGIGTYQTMELLRESLSHHYSIIIGQDNADTIAKWRHSERLLAEYSFIVFQRDQPPAKDAWYLKEPHHFVSNKDFPYQHVSSTTIREAVKQQQDISGYVTKSVSEYIKEHHLYT